MNITITTIDEIIKDLTENCLGGWIYENGKIKDDVLCIDTRDLLEEFKQFELPYDEAMELCENLVALHGEEAMGYDYYSMNGLASSLTFGDIATKSDNTYNWGANISHDINFDCFEYDDEKYVAIMVHRYGDVRANYTYYAILKCDFYDLFDLEFYPSVDIAGTNLVADLRWYSECYDVYDLDTNESYDGYYDVEMSDLLFRLKEDGVIKDASEVLNDD